MNIKWLEHNPRRKWDRNSKRAKRDTFGPPAEAVEVYCLHCGLEYSSDDMIWGTKEGVHSLTPLWWCATPWCDGAGFGKDLFPVKKEKVA